MVGTGRSDCRPERDRDAALGADLIDLLRERRGLTYQRVDWFLPARDLCIEGDLARRLDLEGE